MTSTRSATVRAASRSWPARNHVDHPTESAATSPGTVRTATRRARARPPPRPPGAHRPTIGEDQLGGEHGDTGRPVRREHARRHGEQGGDEQGEGAAPGHERDAAGAAGAGRGGRGGRRARGAARGRGAGAAEGAAGAAGATRWCTCVARSMTCRVVGGGDDRSAGLPVGRDQPDDGRPGAAVLADRGLVGEQHRRAVVQGGGHRETALLPSGQLARVGRLEVGQAQGGEQCSGPLVWRGRARGRRWARGRRQWRRRRGVVGGIGGLIDPGVRVTGPLEGARGGEHLVEHGARDDRRARPLRAPRRGCGRGRWPRARRAARRPGATASGAARGGAREVEGASSAR